MAQKPDGKSASTERVTFTRPAAERIAKVVRAAEHGNRDTVGLSFGFRSPGGASPVSLNLCTFTGAWNKNTSRVLQIAGDNTANTVEAHNITFDIASNAECEGDGRERKVFVAKSGTAWYYVEHERECQYQFPAKELDNSADCSLSNTGSISGGDGVEVLLNDTGCCRWWKLTRELVVTNVEWDDGIVVTKRYVWVVRDPDEGLVNTIVSAINCEDE